MKAVLFTDPHFGFDDSIRKIPERVLNELRLQTFDLIAISGDWGAMKLVHVYWAFKAFREAFPDKKIIGVLGNHDLWDKEIRSLSEKFLLIQEWAKEFDIHLLEKNPYEVNGFLFLGFNGWYYQEHQKTKDHEYIFPYTDDGENVDNFLRKQADEAVNFMIDYPKENKTVISMSHFPCVSEIIDKPELSGNPMHGEILTEFSDVIIFGHTHVPVDVTVGKSRVINSGADYNRFVYKIVDLKKREA